MIDIVHLRQLVTAESMLWTEHAALRLRERGIKRADVTECIQGGTIIEQYPEDMPFSSCLLLGRSTSEKPLHVVCGHNPGTQCCIITAYYPSLAKWNADYKTRKEGGSHDLFPL